MADPITLLLLAVAPACFLIKYILIKDKYKHEPMRLVFVTFALGAVLLVIALIIEDQFANGTVLSYFLVVGGSEEFVKFAAVRIKAYRSPHFYEVMDGIVFGFAAALGFATVENIMYVFQHGYITGITRAFLSVPGHAAYGGIMGYYLGLAKCSTEKSKSRFIITGLAIAILAHGAYDSVLTVPGGNLGFVAAIAIDLICWIYVIRLIKKALVMSPRRWGSAVDRGLAATAAPVQSTRSTSTQFCGHCGARLTGTRFCTKCGHPTS